ncbi:signal recognition particle-docking protein FtsY [Rodentibacter rarus]|uniref:Signal recognition particle receptor FtsY n=1 Tax=Rodentibacter rarus TaxID=1908260 RepID=A0A1V3INY3_9PAST|nr:signal recognition particle-docking protein FtsY [Rodentibacter rarus]OOF41911.1 signal recognition particle-docking protein FtsY [Rodentibacter rarus]OOF43982.1 signal recognition particle-docking protein FtsY [Rodentibacter rarus]
MVEEKKKGGFWASLFGRNKKQESTQIEPTIEEEKIEETAVENEIIEPSVEKVKEQSDKAESAVNFDAVLTEEAPKDEVEQAEIEEKNSEISTALEHPDTIIEPENVEENCAVEGEEIEADIVEEVKQEFHPEAQLGAQSETREKPSEGGFFSRLVKGLLKTKQNIGAGFRHFFLGKKIDDELFEELEEQLLIADIGVPTTTKIIKNLTEHASRKQLQDAELLYQQLKVEMATILEPVAQPLTIDRSKKPYVILMVGVNGVGKTTTIGKLARKFQEEGKSVMLAAGDTFRAAAVEQLQVWGERNHIPVIAQSTGADSASVIFDAMQSAAARNIDILIADTAGRLQNKNNLMDELKKIVRVMKKYDETAPHEIMLTLDAGTGQNAISQAKLFNEAVGLTGISLTKLDGTAKGGVIFAIADQFNLPIRYIGVGEKIEDLREFNAQEFIDALFIHEEE